MPQQEEPTPIERRARAVFGTLSIAERKLLRAVPDGVAAWCGPSHRNDDPANNPGLTDDKEFRWGPDREIRGELIRWICVDSVTKRQVDPAGIAVYAAKIKGPLALEFVTVPFPIRLLRCWFAEDITMYLGDFAEVNLSGSRAKSLIADGIKVTGSILLNEGFHAEGDVHLVHAQIGGNLDCEAGVFKNDPSDLAYVAALNASGIRVSGSVFLRDGFRANGEVKLLGAQIDGNLVCSKGIFINPRKDGGGGDALSAHLAGVKGTVFLNGGFRAEGATRLVGAQIGGDLDCDGGTFINPASEAADTGKALQGDGMIVRGNVFFRDFLANGEVSLLDVQIGATLGCMRGAFVNPSKTGVEKSGSAFSADRASIRGDVFISNGFRAEGRVRLPGAHVGGDLHCHEGELKHAILDLREASVSSFWDDEKSWPESGNLFLDGFVYGRIVNGPTNAKSRLKWLALQPQFTTQPYLQLAKVLREAGDNDGAQEVLITMEDRRWETREDHYWTDPFIRWPLKFTVGYGYDPLRAFWEVLALTALGWIIYRRSYIAGNVVPAEKDAYESFHLHQKVPANYPRFSPLVYSVENSLPLVRLGQTDKWQPRPELEDKPSGPNWYRERPRKQRSRSRLSNYPRARRVLLSFDSLAKRTSSFLVYLGLKAPTVVDGEGVRPGPAGWATSPRFLRWFLWVQILLGWLLATLFLAGITGIVRKD